MQIAAAHCGRPQSSPRCKPACFASVKPIKPSHAVPRASASRPTASAEQQADVVVVGAGVAGLNAWTKLHAAALRSSAPSPSRQRLRSPAAQTALPSSSPTTQPQPPPLPSQASGSGPLLLWYKRDLRLDDHPGWHAAAEAAASSGVVPVFCFDPARYAHVVQPSGGAEALCRALASLDRSLRHRGSRLVVRVGAWEEQMPLLAAQLGASGIVVEHEVEADWCQAVSQVEAALPEGVPVQHWRAPLLDSHADDYRDLKALQPGINSPLPVLSQLPPLPESAAEALQLQKYGNSGSNGGSSGSNGLGINAAQLRQLAAEAYGSSLSPQLRQIAGSASAATSSNGRNGNAAGFVANSSGSSFSSEEEGGKLIDRLVSSAAGGGEAGDSSSGGWQGSGTTGSVGAAWEAEVAAEIAAGEGPVLQALGAYLRSLETAAEGGIRESEGDEDDNVAAAAEAAVEALAGGALAKEVLAQAISAHDLPATPDGCFPALFGRALALGVVSKRRVYAEATALLAQQAEQAQPPPTAPLRLLAWLLTTGGGASARLRRQKKAAAAAAAVEARDFHEQMAAEREGRQAHGASLHHWRWRGLLTDYLSASGASSAPGGGEAAAERPAILLVHGFGAFSEHYRDNVAALAAAGYDVYAPTLPGYGRAEKPVLPYGQGLWTDFLAEFVLQVVRRPVVVAGNSIGGFISASLAADHPGLVQGLVLLNSAGRTVKGYQPPAEEAKGKPPPAFVVDGVARALFAYLEGGVEGQLRRVYPVRPDRAGAWLAGEIVRAARDPGALGVFRSVFYLPPPRALNYLVTSLFKGPTLVLQGMKDPLNNAPARASELEQCCPNAQVVKLDAGHCPHDEIPERVNSEILAFIEQRVLAGDGGMAATAEQAAAKTQPAAAS